MVVDIRQKDGVECKTLGIPIKLSKTSGSIRTPLVDFRENTVSILQELGYPENQIKSFAKKGVF